MGTWTKNRKPGNIRSEDVSCRVVKVWQSTQGSIDRIQTDSRKYIIPHVGCVRRKSGHRIRHVGYVSHDTQCLYGYVYIYSRSKTNYGRVGCFKATGVV